MNRAPERLVLVKIEKAGSGGAGRAHFVDRDSVREVLAGAHTRFVPKVSANEPDATGQLVVKPVVVKTLCGQDVDPVALASFESRYCQTCVALAGAAKIVAATGYRA